MIDHEGIVYPFGIVAVNTTCNGIMVADLACGEGGLAEIVILGASDVAVTGAEPPAYPALVVVIVAVDGVLAATPVTVTKPVLLFIATVPAVAVPAHVYKVLLLSTV